MASRLNTRDFKQLFINDVPMMDVRAPVEFKQGAFPDTVNLPLMDDDERKEVGTCYKEKGQEAAIELGHQLVAAEIKQQRVAAWSTFANENPQGYLYCFRGGLRSKVTQQWLKEAGIDYPFIEGGYKAMRRFLIDIIDQEAATNRLVILTGRTGTGKTKVIERVAESVDLEGLANHRGSSFGRRATPQPSQINFENQLAIDLLKLRENTDGKLLVEDESVNIGGLHIPTDFFATMNQASLVILEEPMNVRIDTVIEDYVIELSKDHQNQAGEEGFARYSEYMLAAMDRIRKRLGSERHQQIKSILADALKRQLNTGDLTLHRVWIEQLLSQYYDPMYDYQLSKKQDRVVFKGNREQVISWFAQYR